MQNLTKNIYRAILSVYKIIPEKRIFCHLLKKIKIPNNKFYKDFKFTGKFKVMIDKENYFFMFHHGGTIENETFWKGLFATYENDTGWIWKQLCPLSNIIFDVGANTGIYSLIAKTINKKAIIYAFEPSINTYCKLIQNNKLNHFDINCEQIAVSNLNGEQIFYDTYNSNQLSASLSAEKLKNWDGYTGKIKEYNVKTMTLAKFIESKKIPKIDLMKIDIEMHEPEALEGFGDYIELFKPIVLIEVLSDVVAEKLNKIISSDYILFHLKNNKEAELVSKFKAVPEKWNYIFFHKELEEKIKRHTTLYK